MAVLDQDDEPEDGHGPLPPEDRLWRHPSELSGVGAVDGEGRRGSVSPTERERWKFVAVGVAIGVVVTIAIGSLLGAGSPRDVESDRDPASREPAAEDPVPAVDLDSLVLELHARRNGE
ncbi:MAG: hypothetical protein OSA99_09305 [Acidimicrobiales bacterium]|nr:hypothetical protein [Acidimicrobiales bacterium]